MRKNHGDEENHRGTEDTERRREGNHERHERKKVHPGEAFLRLRESERKARYEEEPQITQITGITQMKEQFFGGVLLSSAVCASSSSIFFFFVCVIRAISVIRGSSSVLPLLEPEFSCARVSIAQGEPDVPETTQAV
jgi:hypothetical protein